MTTLVRPPRPRSPPRSPTGAALAQRAPATRPRPRSAPTLRSPNDATITVAGRGFGHGHGLSQYGAQGAARQGRTAMQIVRFYYPHTRAGTAKDVVRVHITADTDNNTTVVARPGLKVRDLGTGTTTPSRPRVAVGKASRWRLSAGRGGTTKVSYLTGGLARCGRTSSATVSSARPAHSGSSCRPPW